MRGVPALALRDQRVPGGHGTRRQGRERRGVAGAKTFGLSGGPQPEGPPPQSGAELGVGQIDQKWRLFNTPGGKIKRKGLAVLGSSLQLVSFGPLGFGELGGPNCWQYPSSGAPKVWTLTNLLTSMAAALNNSRWFRALEFGVEVPRFILKSPVGDRLSLFGTKGFNRPNCRRRWILGRPARCCAVLQPGLRWVKSQGFCSGVQRVLH